MSFGLFMILPLVTSVVYSSSSDRVLSSRTVHSEYPITLYRLREIQKQDSFYATPVLIRLTQEISNALRRIFKISSILDSLGRG